jgi:hypothetical protein
VTFGNQQALNDATSLALGRVVIAFSGLLYSLESSTVHLMAFSLDGTQRPLIQAALAERTASPIVSSFFSVFHKRWEGELAADDIVILKCLRKECDAIVKERNRLMHDAWMSKVVGGDPSPQLLSRHRVRAHGSGVDYESVDYSPETLNRFAEDIGRVSSVVTGTTFCMRPGQKGPELGPRMYVSDGKVMRLPGSGAEQLRSREGEPAT